MRFLLCLWMMAAAGIDLPPHRTDALLVRSVIDGDTIDVAAYGRVRLLGIDAPEMGRGFDTAAPFAREARDRLASLVLRRWVRLELEGATLDVYNRRLAYVFLEDGQFVNAVLVRDGLARVTARAPLSRLPELKRAEAEAQAFRRGMWGSTPSLPSTPAELASKKKGRYTSRASSGRRHKKVRAGPS
jgi:micrococcal nuclease